MNKQEKIKKIKELYKKGEIKPLGNGCFSCSSECFILGITQDLINEVLKN